MSYPKIGDQYHVDGMTYTVVGVRASNVTFHNGASYTHDTLKEFGEKL